MARTALRRRGRPPRHFCLVGAIYARRAPRFRRNGWPLSARGGRDGPVADRGGGACRYMGEASGRPVAEAVARETSLCVERTPDFPPFEGHGGFPVRTEAEIFGQRLANKGDLGIDGAARWPAVLFCRIRQGHAPPGLFQTVVLET